MNFGIILLFFFLNLLNICSSITTIKLEDYNEIWTFTEYKHNVISGKLTIEAKKHILNKHNWDHGAKHFSDCNEFVKLNTNDLIGCYVTPFAYHEYTCCYKNDTIRVFGENKYENMIVSFTKDWFEENRPDIIKRMENIFGFNIFDHAQYLVSVKYVNKNN